MEMSERALLAAKALVLAIKEDTDEITVDESRVMVHRIREAEGWLLSARKMLDP